MIMRFARRFLVCGKLETAGECVCFGEKKASRERERLECDLMRF